MSRELRKRTRIPGCFEATVVIGAEKIPVVTQNLSLKGLLCSLKEGQTAIQIGAPCQVRIRLTETIEISVNGRIARADADATAIDFNDMDENSYAHLRNVIRFSSHDADAIDAEQLVTPFQAM